MPGGIWVKNSLKRVVKDAPGVKRGGGSTSILTLRLGDGRVIGMSMKFCWELRPTDGNADFGRELNAQLPPLVRRLLAQRGIAGRDEAIRFLRPRLSDLQDSLHRHVHLP